MYFKTFKGGIHPPENKGFTRDNQFSNLPIPQVCYIPLRQHIGKPAVPVVEIGDTVEVGQIIGKADGFVSSNIHSSIPGKVIEIAGYPTVYSKNEQCIVIELHGAFNDITQTSCNEEWKDLDPKDIFERIQEAGIVGMGGAAFPTPVKLSPPEDKEIDTLIINGSECEPYLTVDDMLMQSFPAEIVEGVRITLKIIGIKNACIGIEKNKPQAISALQEAVKKIPMEENISVEALKTKYPQGAEKQLIFSILNREVPSGRLPMDVGVVVQNVGTVHAIREAVVFRKPLYERYITITGQIVNNPGNYKVRIGSRISDIIEECGGLKEDAAKIIMGGPMCGISIQNLNIPIIKGTSGVLFLSKREVFSEDYKPCIRCGRCVSVCPVSLLPSEIANATEKDRLDILEQLNPYDCVMCGSCSYVCPARRPIGHFIKLAQEKLRRKKTA